MVSVTVWTREGGRQNEETGGDGTGGRDDRGRRGGMEEGERAGRGGERKGNLAPTVISKSRRLWYYVKITMIVTNEARNPPTNSRDQEVS